MLKVRKFQAEATLKLFQAETLAETQVDSEVGVIRNVSLISLGEAKGHDCFVDGTTLRQVFEFCETIGTLKVKLDHGSGVLSTSGYMDNFSLQKNKVVGDFYIYESEPERNRIFEIAQKNPDHMGMSLEFSGEDEMKAGKCFARCEEVSAIALVSDPAANKSLFEKKKKLAEKDGFSTKDADSKKTNLTKMKKDLSKTAKTTEEKLLEAVTSLVKRFEVLEKKFEEKDDKEMDIDEMDDDKKDDKELSDGQDDVDPKTKIEKQELAEGEDANNDKKDLEEGDDEEDDKEAKPAKKDDKKMSSKDQVKALASKLGIRINFSAGAQNSALKKPEKKNFQTLVDEKTKELGDPTKAMIFCLQNHKEEYAESTKKFLSRGGK